MKLNLKKYVAGTLVLFTFVPIFAFAEDNASATGVANRKAGVNFCSRISTIDTRTANQIKNLEERQSKKQDEKTDKVIKRQGDVDEKRFKNRTDADGKRLENWGRMEGKAKTDAQKTAVEAYKNAIKSAVDARRTAVDSAVKAYRDGLTAILGTHNGSIDNAIATFKASIDSAVVKAKSDCASNIDPKTVKANFEKAVKDARDALKLARKNAEITSGIKELKKTRDDAINIAITNFKTATEKARADLKIALGQN